MFDGICYNQDIPRHKRSKPLFEKLKGRPSERENCSVEEYYGYVVKKEVGLTLDNIDPSIALIELEPTETDGWSVCVAFGLRRWTRSNLTVGVDGLKFWCCASRCVDKYISTHSSELQPGATWFDSWERLKKRIRELGL